MGIRYLTRHAALEGVVGVEEAESLVEFLERHADAVVGLADCEHVHAAVLQVLLVFRPRLAGVARDPWLARVLARDAGERP